jgi:hypothetical protein
MFLSREHHDDPGRLCHLIDSGDLIPSIDRVYTLEEAPDALRQLEAGQIAGKAVIGISEWSGHETSPPFGRQWVYWPEGFES